MGVGDVAWMTADWFFCLQLQKLSEATRRGHSMLVLVQRDNFQIVRLKGCWKDANTFVCAMMLYGLKLQRAWRCVLVRSLSCESWPVCECECALGLWFFLGELRECFPVVPVCAMAIQTDANSSALCQSPVRGDTDSGLVSCVRVPFSFYLLNHEIF